MSDLPEKWTVDRIRKSKGVRRLGCVTAYDSAFARLADEAGVPMILVGDSIGNNVLGYENTLPVDMDDIIRATSAVARGAKRALIVADMPFGSFQTGDDAAVANAIRCLKAGAGAVKIEGGAFRVPLVKRLVENGIPVLAHIGLTPQSVNQTGGFKMQGKTREAAEGLFKDAAALEVAGAFAITLECVPDDVAAAITSSVKIPTVGIGAGPVCDAQWLVMHDLLGLNEKSPSFVKHYAELAGIVKSAFASYVEEVSSGAFPSPRQNA